MLKRTSALSFFLIVFAFCRSQQLALLAGGKTFSLRGLSVVSDQIIWASGSGGTFVLSTDSGKTWAWQSIKGYERTDFRDIQAFSEKEAVIMGVTEPAVILRTTDGGRSWMKVFEDSSKAIFLDAMAFSGDNAILVGDPVNDKIFLAQSPDRGRSWKRQDPSGFDSARTGESFFAASGSNCLIQKIPFAHPYFQYMLVSGGKKSCLYISPGPEYPGGRFTLKLLQGKETTGANSIAINPSNTKEAYVVGGDFSNDTVRYGNSVLVRLFPFRQIVPDNPPHGYRSCVEYINNEKLICCGPGGVDLSLDGGMNWKLISNTGFHVCKKALNGKFVYLAGAGGKIARLEF
jgi:hypothetical protein